MPVECASVVVPERAANASSHGEGWLDEKLSGDRELCTDTVAQNDTATTRPKAVTRPRVHLEVSPGQSVQSVLCAAAPLRASSQTGAGCATLLEGVITMLKPLPNSLGEYIRTMGAPLQPRPLHTSCRDIFPMPWFVAKVATRGRAREKESATLERLAIRLTNVWLAFLNFLH